MASLATVSRTFAEQSGDYTRATRMDGTALRAHRLRLGQPVGAPLQDATALYRNHTPSGKGRNGASLGNRFWT